MARYDVTRFFMTLSLIGVANLRLRETVANGGGQNHLAARTTADKQIFPTDIYCTNHVFALQTEDTNSTSVS